MNYMCDRWCELLLNTKRVHTDMGKWVSDNIREKDKTLNYSASLIALIVGEMQSYAAGLEYGRKHNEN